MCALPVHNVLWLAGVEGEIAPCQDSDFTCKDGSCIPKRKHCDGRHDCPQGEDEMDCSDGNVIHVFYFFNVNKVRKLGWNLYKAGCSGVFVFILCY